MFNREARTRARRARDVLLRKGLVELPCSPMPAPLRSVLWLTAYPAPRRDWKPAGFSGVGWEDPNVRVEMLRPWRGEGHSGGTRSWPPGSPLMPCLPCSPAITVNQGEMSSPQRVTSSQQQTRISASSATRELDELMASLSDFKVPRDPSSSPPPHSPPLYLRVSSWNLGAQPCPEPGTLRCSGLTRMPSARRVRPGFTGTGLPHSLGRQRRT